MAQAVSLLTLASNIIIDALMITHPVFNARAYVSKHMFVCLKSFKVSVLGQNMSDWLSAFHEGWHL